MKKIVVIFCSLLCVASLGFAQTETGKIIGKVTESQGLPFPGVSITLIGENIGKMTAVSDKAGHFRFLNLPVGKDYELTFELKGFKTFQRKGIDIRIGSTTEVNVEMAQSPIEETATVIAPSPLVDLKSSRVALNISSEQIARLPTARDPWVIMNLAPGMLLDREDVGGSQSGQASQWSGYGSTYTDTNWRVDGANVTEAQSGGGPPGYLDVNSFEEMQVSYAANSVTYQTGGTQINYVSKSGGNRFTGSFHLNVEDEAWQLDNLSKHSKASLAPTQAVAPGIFRLYQYGADFGGPILRDHLFFFGYWGLHDIHARTIINTEDATVLPSGYGKLSWQFGKNMGSFLLNYNNQKKWGRANYGAANQDNGTLMDTTQPSYIYILTDSQIFGDLLLTLKVSRNQLKMDYAPRGSKVIDGINVGNDWLVQYYPRSYVSGSIQYFFTDMKQWGALFSGNYFAKEILGADHEIIFGLEYSTSKTLSLSLYPNQRRLLRTTDLGQPYDTMEARTTGGRDPTYARYSAYFTDTATFGRFNVTLGLRYDQEQGGHQGAKLIGFSIDGVNPWPDYIGDVNAPASVVDKKWKVLSPRLSLVYDITGDGKNAVKLSLSRYGSQAGTRWLADLKGMLTMRVIAVPWYDLNHDGKPELGEFPATGSLADALYYSGFDPRNPYNTISSNQFDPNFNSPLLDELALSYEREITTNLAASATFLYRKKHNQIRDIGIMADNSLETADNWYLAGTGTGPIEGRPYYTRYKTPAATYRTNYKNTYERYLAGTLTIKKRFSQRWMLDASFTYIDWKQFRDKSEYFDLTNFDFFNGGTLGDTSWTDGEVYLNSRWQVKVNGLYQLPYDINLSFVFQARDGFPAPYYLPVTRTGLAAVNVYQGGKKFGDDRLHAFWILNFGVEKVFRLSEKTQVAIHVDAYNVTNNATVLGRSCILIGTTGRINEFLGPTVFQFGVRYQY